MNANFLTHLNSITPDGKANERRIFVPADVIKKEVENADELRKLDSIEELNEATRSKYLKIYGKHKVGSDESNLNLARLKRDMAMLQRGGADAETMKKAAAARGRYDRGEKPDPSYNPHDTVMAGYRFARKATRSFDVGKKSPRKAAVSESIKLDEGFMRKQRLLRARTSGKTRTPAAQKALDTAYDSELGRRVARKLRKGGARKSTVRSFINTDKPSTPAANRAFAKFNDAEYKKHKELQAKGVNPKRLGFAESTKISEGSLGMKKGIRITKSVYQKGNTGLGKRMDAGILRSYSKTRAEVGLDPRITVPAPRYSPSDAEYAAMQGHADKRRKGINKKYGIAEATKKVNPIKKKYKGVKKTAKRVLNKLYQSLSTPQDNIDFMITGRKS